MGKTIQTIALICNQHLDDQKKKKKNGKTRPTLIVTPSSALLQWQAEIERFTTENALKVFVFHSKRKGITPSDLDYDVVLTCILYVSMSFDVWWISKDCANFAAKNIFPQNSVYTRNIFANWIPKQRELQSKPYRKEVEVSVCLPRKLWKPCESKCSDTHNDLQRAHG